MPIRVPEPQKSVQNTRSGYCIRAYGPSTRKPFWIRGTIIGSAESRHYKLQRGPAKKWGTFLPSSPPPAAVSSFFLFSSTQLRPVSSFFSASGGGFFLLPSSSPPPTYAAQNTSKYKQLSPLPLFPLVLISFRKCGSSTRSRRLSFFVFPCPLFFPLLSVFPAHARLSSPPSSRQCCRCLTHRSARAPHTWCQGLCKMGEARGRLHPHVLLLALLPRVPRLCGEYRGVATVVCCSGNAPRGV